MSTARRTLLEPAYLLHHRPWSDTSRILELMTRAHGRITLFAHGARRPKSPLRGLLQPFVPLLISWSGRADGGTLTGAELGGAIATLPRPQLLSGFYLNELLLRLLPKEDRHERLFDAYAEALSQLAGEAGNRALRVFERVLLDELGYGPDLTRDSGSGGTLEPDLYYHFEPGRGLLGVQDAAARPGAFRGEELLAVARGDYGRPQTLAVARRIFGAAIASCLEGRGLASREVMLALRRREQDG
ncbi:MAG: DNA repair protein RecO [Steroidobacteraceae bacterium]